MEEVPGSQKFFPAQLIFLALGFLGPEGDAVKALGVKQDARTNVQTPGPKKYSTNVEGVFAAGDCRRGQSLIVWGIKYVPMESSETYGPLMSFCFAARVAVLQQRLTNGSAMVPLVYRTTVVSRSEPSFPHQAVCLKQASLKRYRLKAARLRFEFLRLDSRTRARHQNGIWDLFFVVIHLYYACGMKHTVSYDVLYVDHSYVILPHHPQLWSNQFTYQIHKYKIRMG